MSMTADVAIRFRVRTARARVRTVRLAAKRGAYNALWSFGSYWPAPADDKLSTTARGTWAPGAFNEPTVELRYHTART